MIARAQILLALDETLGGAPDRWMVAERLGVSEGTVFRVAKQYAQHGGRIDDVIVRKKRVTPPVEPKVTGDVEARVLALARTPPPEGRTRWSLRLLEKQVLVTDGIPALSHSTIAAVLQKGGSSLT
jgi:transposase